MAHACSGFGSSLHSPVSNIYFAFNNVIQIACAPPIISQRKYLYPFVVAALPTVICIVAGLLWQLDWILKALLRCAFAILWSSEAVGHRVRVDFEVWFVNFYCAWLVLFFIYFLSPMSLCLLRMRLNVRLNIGQATTSCVHRLFCKRTLCYALMKSHYSIVVCTSTLR